MHHCEVMTNNDDRTESIEKLWRMVDDFRIGMLITRPQDGAPRPRPMTMARRDEETITFVTSRDNTLVEELERDPGCAISLQSDRKYVALRGLAVPVDDTAAVEKMWTEAMRVWFPDGPRSGRLVLVHMNVVEAEHWDVSGIQMARFLFRAAQAYAQGRRLDEQVTPTSMHAGLTL